MKIVIVPKIKEFKEHFKDNLIRGLRLSSPYKYITLHQEDFDLRHKDHIFLTALS